MGRVYVERALETPAGIDRAPRFPPRAAPARGGASSTFVGPLPDSGQGRRCLRRQGKRHRPPKSPGRWGVPSVIRPARSAASKKRARYMLNIAPRGARPRFNPATRAGFERQIKRVPLGLVVARGSVELPPT